jgi:Asp-tRNA(Asn)/Glu-tRNA(Gln) amidotransferase A subunit family amidase
VSSAVEISVRLRAGEMSVTETAETLAGVLGDDPYAAWAALDAEDLLAQARSLDKLGEHERAGLPLFGVPVGIKDAFDTSTLPTAYGSPIYESRRPARDAESVCRLRSAGALIAGKTRCAELSWMTAPETANPVAGGRTPGGSSSGSAAAVAAGQVPLATGTQTAGSVIRPASYCAVLGFKPTFATFPRGGAMPLSATLDTVGVFARELDDLALLSEVLWGPDEREPTIRGTLPLRSDPGERQPRIGFARTPFWDQVETDAREAIEGFLAGAELEEVELPEGFRTLSEAQRTIQWVEGAAALRHELESTPERLSPELREALCEGREITPDEYEAALEAARRYTGPLHQLLAGFDGVLVPSASGVPPEGLEFTGDPLFCRAFTLAGVPCLALPLVRTSSGLPVGLQLVGSRLQDRRLLRAARRLVDRTAPS